MFQTRKLIPLRAAQRQILTDKLFSESGAMDAMSLLGEVEDELDESFRDQIFDALKQVILNCVLQWRTEINKIIHQSRQTFQNFPFNRAGRKEVYNSKQS